MSLESLFDDVPFVESLGIEVTAVDDGHAEARLSLREEHTSNPHGDVAHGGVTYSLADTVAGAAVVSLTGDVAPTVDMRIDYLAPATADLRAEADVVRRGGSVAVADVEVYATASDRSGDPSVATGDADDDHVATARGVYKTGGQDGDSPWSAGAALPTDETAPDGDDSPNEN